MLVIIEVSDLVTRSVKPQVSFHGDLPCVGHSDGSSRNGRERSGGRRDGRLDSARGDIGQLDVRRTE